MVATISKRKAWTRPALVRIDPQPALVRLVLQRNAVAQVPPALHALAGDGERIES